MVERKGRRCPNVHQRFLCGWKASEANNLKWGGHWGYRYLKTSPLLVIRYYILIIYMLFEEKVYDIPSNETGAILKQNISLAGLKTALMNLWHSCLRKRNGRTTLRIPFVLYVSVKKRKSQMSSTEVTF